MNYDFKEQFMNKGVSELKKSPITKETFPEGPSA